MKDFLRSLWRALFPNRAGLEPTPRLYQYEEDLLQVIRDLAVQEERPEEDVTAELISLVLAKKESNTLIIYHWNYLSFREQQVLALVCLNYTNQQIAFRLGISTTTVATHIRGILQEFDLHSKADLRLALAGWDFRAWEERT